MFASLFLMIVNFIVIIYKTSGHTVNKVFLCNIVQCHRKISFFLSLGNVRVKAINRDLTSLDSLVDKLVKLLDTHIQRQMSRKESPGVMILCLITSRTRRNISQELRWCSLAWRKRMSDEIWLHIWSSLVEHWDIDTSHAAVIYI